MRDLINPERDESLTVYYDGACPICSREIAVYRNSRGAETVSWVDVHSNEFSLQGDLGRQRALDRFHVRRSDGELVSGVPAFRELWSHLPAYRWLARVTRGRTITTLLEHGYAVFLKRRNLPQSSARQYSKLPHTLRRHLRSSQTSKLGAVWIYRGIVTAARDRQVRQLAKKHLATQRTHLALMSDLIPFHRRSMINAFWASAAYTTGLIVALASPNAVFITFNTVTALVDEQYRQSIKAFGHDSRYEDILRLLERCRTDKIAHRGEARQYGLTPGSRLSGWCTNAFVRISATAVSVARVI